MQDFANRQGLGFTILLDEQSSVARTYRVQGIPTTFLIDREGVIRARHTGPLDRALIDRYVERLLP